MFERRYMFQTDHFKVSTLDFGRVKRWFPSLSHLPDPSTVWVSLRLANKDSTVGTWLLSHRSRRSVPKPEVLAVLQAWGAVIEVCWLCFWSVFFCLSLCPCWFLKQWMWILMMMVVMMMMMVVMMMMMMMMMEIAYSTECIGASEQSPVAGSQFNWWLATSLCFHPRQWSGASPRFGAKTGGESSGTPADPKTDRGHVRCHGPQTPVDSQDMIWRLLPFVKLPTRTTENWWFQNFHFDELLVLGRVIHFDRYPKASNHLCRFGSNQIPLYHTLTRWLDINW